MAGTPRTDTRTMEEQQQAFLNELEVYGNVTEACKRAKVSRKTIYSWKVKFPEFEKQFKESAKIGVEALEDEARRRAFKGTLKPIYQGGKKMGTVREYSDTLLIFLLKGNKPGTYKERTEHSGDPDNPIKHEHTVTKVIFEDMTEQPK